MSEAHDRELAALVPAVEASLDCVAILDSGCHIFHLNRAMRAFLELKPRQVTRQLTICDVVKLTACADGCQIKEIIKTGEPLRLDEAPAALGDSKRRVSLKGIALYAADDESKSRPIGAMITLRDSTAEVIVQAKYHKLLQMLDEKDVKIGDLATRLEDLRVALRKAAFSRVSK